MNLNPRTHVQRAGQPGQPIIAHLGLWFQKMGLIIAGQGSGAPVRPEVRMDMGLQLLTYFLIILIFNWEELSGRTSNERDSGVKKRRWWVETGSVPRCNGSL